MKKELDEILCKKYPKIFRDRNAPITKTLMCWGFDCGDGWYNIIDKLCANIQNHIKNTRSHRLYALKYNRALARAIKGDLDSFEKYFYKGNDVKSIEYAKNMASKDLERKKFRKVPEACSQVVASQVKEKYGTLRFYVYGGDEFIQGLISMAESISAVTCEHCGNSGKIRDGAWIRTLCDTHAVESGYTEDDDENQSSQ